MEPTKRSEHSFVFAEGQGPKCLLVVSSLQNEMEVHAATLLASAVEEISLARPEIIAYGDQRDMPGRVLIGSPSTHKGVRDVLRANRVLGVSEDLRPEVANLQLLVPEDLSPQDFVVYLDTDEGRPTLVVAGKSSVGTMYGVSTLISRLFMRGSKLIVDWLGSRLLPIISHCPFKYRSLFTGIGGPDPLASPDQWGKEWSKGGRYDYQGFIDWLVSHKVNHLVVSFHLDYGAIYPSDAFPELVNPYHPNVRHEFLGDMIEYAHQRGIEIFAFADFPDSMSAVVRAHPDWAGANVDRSLLMDEDAWYNYQKTGTGRLRQRVTASWVCGSKPEVMDFWRVYWEDLMGRYPGIDGVGMQPCEHPEARCDCPDCRRTFMDQPRVYFEEMLRIARSKNPLCRPWMYRAWGGAKMMKELKRAHDLKVIDWWATFPRFLMHNYRPRSDWYLYHVMHTEWPEFGFKQMPALLAQSGVEMYQIRGVKYLETDHLYQAYEEFAWCPELSIEDYTFLYVLKRFRREDRELAEAYAHWIKATGYAEILANPDVPRAWVEREDYRSKLRAEVTRLSPRLAEIGVPAEYVESVRRAAATEALTPYDLAWSWQAVALEEWTMSIAAGMCSSQATRPTFVQAKGGDSHNRTLAPHNTHVYEEVRHLEGMYCE